MSRGYYRGWGATPGRGPYKAGPGGMCVCPKCEHKQTHARGVACTDTKCAKCGTKMVREGVK